MIKNKTNGFSLFEVLLSMVIVSAILVLMLPLTTKLVKPAKKKNNAAIFTYNSPTNDNKDFPCYITEIDDTGNLILTKNSGKCEIHKFYIPKGVHKIDLTMVAGGGGGGGASGEIEHIINLKNSGATTNKISFLQEKLKKVVIKYLAGRGGPGKNAILSGEEQSGDSGNSASMVYNYEIPLEKLPKRDDPDFIMESWSYTAEPFNCSNSGCKYNNGGIIPGLSFYSYKIKEHYGNLGSPSSSYYLIGAKKAFIPTSTETEEKKGCLEITEKNNIHPENPSYKLSETMNCINSSKEINSGTKPTSDDESKNYFTIDGGKEKRILPHISAGAGGAGASLIGYKKNNTAWTYKSINNPIEPTNEGGEIEVTVAYPAAVASGGTAGTVVKLNGLSVKPNEKYTIVVGSGGIGGLKGSDGLLNDYTAISPTLTNPKDAYIKFPTNGENGQGGSTTSIYNENGELLLMVAGGIGGVGGQITNNATNIITNWKTKGLAPFQYKADKATPLPKLPEMAANKPLLIYGANFDIDKIEIDNSIIDKNNFKSAGSSNYILGTEKINKGAFTYNYKYSTETLSPIKNLTIDKNDTADVKTNRAFAGYHHLLNNDENAIDTSSFNVNNIYKTINGRPLYNGLYFRYNPEGKDLMYAGGLGGFSAISPKAGCGGAFVGNYDGRLNEIDYHTGDAKFDATQQGTFTLTDNKGNSKTFFVNDYLNNCTINSSDGQSANFIPPQVSGSSIDFGQAGAGGGGGGWSKLLGSGKGGNGQNGYVLINWD